MKTINIKFHGIDWWSRPVYKVEDMELYIGSLDVLFPDKDIAPNGTAKEINEYFRNNMDKLVLFGCTFDEDDPLGSSIKSSVKIIIKD